MHSRTREVLEHLNTYHAELIDAVDGIPVALRDREPAEGRWSVAGVLEHLAIVNESIATRLSTALSLAREAGLAPEGEESSILDRLDIASIVDRGRPRTASEGSQPKGNVGSSGALAHYERSHSQVCKLVEEYDGLAIGDVHAPHPVFGALDMYQWLLFVGAHEGRHADQIREIGKALRGQESGQASGQDSGRAGATTS